MDRIARTSLLAGLGVTLVVVASWLLVSAADSSPAGDSELEALSPTTGETVMALVALVVLFLVTSGLTRLVLLARARRGHSR